MKRTKKVLGALAIASLISGGLLSCSDEVTYKDYHQMVTDYSDATGGSPVSGIQVNYGDQSSNAPVNQGNGGNNNGGGTTGGTGGNSAGGAGSGSTIGDLGAGTVDVPVNGIKIVKSEGWLNSGYILFESVGAGAKYKVCVDGVEIDAPLIRSYDTYTYTEQKEDAELQVSYDKKTFSNVVRADALGLTAGEHEMTVCEVSKPEIVSKSTIKVANHDRQGFAFSSDKTPGAYNMDGTLKEGTTVIYLTNDNLASVKATFKDPKGKTNEFTGVPAITQAIKDKYTNGTPVCIRIIGQIGRNFKSDYSKVTSADMKSAYALGVKEGSFVTIEGVGDDATMFGAGVAAFQSKYIEIANLGLVKWGGGKDGDGVSLKGTEYAWVHNCDYWYGNAGSDADQVKGDGSMDLKDNSKYVTIAYNHFWDSGKMSLCGMKSESGPNYITYHHNWFDHSDSRHPRVRTMSVHVYNNYFDGNSKYGVGAAKSSCIFVEGNYFRDAHDPMLISMQGTDKDGGGTFSGEDGGMIKSFNNKYDQNNKYQKFQFRTNKKNWVTGMEYQEGKDTQQVTTTYEVSAKGEDGIAKSGIMSSVGASWVDGYWKTAKGKTALTISNDSSKITRIVVNAKCGSSTTPSTKITVGSTTETLDGTYKDVEFTGSDVSGLEIAIKNSGDAQLNITNIKVYSSSEWSKEYSTGCDLTDIDAYEVDVRNCVLPSSIKALAGGKTYDNFDTVLGDKGLGLTTIPTDPDQAKADVMKFAGRHNTDLTWNFNNSVDDAKYSVDTAMNSRIEAYKTGVTKVQE